MMLLEVARRVQSTSLSELLAGSTWAYLVIGALHVLGIAWFGGAVLLSVLRKHTRARPSGAFLWTGVAMMVVTGALLFIIEPQRCLSSQAFRLKMLLLVAIAASSPMRSRFPNVVTVAFWVLVIFASQGIAFF